MNIQLNLKQLESFVRVADLGSFRKAAEQLNTTQPNISSRIARLEKSLDVVLLVRDAGSVSLTGRGQELLPLARDILNSAELFIEQAKTQAIGEGVLRLGVSELIVHTWLSAFMKALKNKHPDIVVELTVDLSSVLETSLENGSIDLAFHSGPFSRSSTGCVELGRYSMIWIASKDIDPSLSGKLTLTDLAQHPVLLHSRSTLAYNQLSEHFRLVDGATPRLVPSSNLSACLQMTLDGLGIALLPAAMLDRDGENRHLRVLDYEWVPDDLHFYARYNAEESLRSIAEIANLAESTSQGFLQNAPELTPD